MLASNCCASHSHVAAAGPIREAQPVVVDFDPQFDRAAAGKRIGARERVGLRLVGQR